MTGRALISLQAREHLCKLLGMLGSDHDGEVAAAGRKAHAHIKRLGVTWGDIIYSPPEPRPWRDMATACAEQLHRLSVRERDFVGNLFRLRWPPSDKQLAWLETIYSRLHGREHAA